MVRRILITGAGGNAGGIGFARCLRRSRERFFLVGCDPDPIHLQSAETDIRLLVPRADSPNYLDCLNAITSEYRIELIHPQPDREIAAISKMRSRLRARTFLPDEKTIELCNDKYHLNQTFTDLSVPCPATIRIDSENDLGRAFKALGTPLWIRASRGAGGRGSLKVGDPKHASMWIDYWKGWGSFTASEYLPGSNLGWDGLFKKGELIVSSLKMRMEYALPGSSPSGITGTASVIKLVEDRKANEIAEIAVRAVDPRPQGAFSVDLKEDGHGRARVTEINPGRFLTSSLHAFYKLGIPIPYAYVNLGLDLDLPEGLRVHGGTAGVILVRNLDKPPICVRESKISRLLRRQEKSPWVRS